MFLEKLLLLFDLCFELDDVLEVDVRGSIFRKYTCFGFFFRDLDRIDLMGYKFVFKKFFWVIFMCIFY